MKNCKRILAMLLVCVMFFTLTACNAKLSGTYSRKDLLLTKYFTFKDDNKVETNVPTLGLVKIEGDYVIEDGQITITYTESVTGLSCDWTKSFKQDGDSVFIDGVEYTKE